MSNYALVIDTNKKPLTPCKPGKARSLLKAGKAAVFRMFPFTIILKKEVAAINDKLTIKIDPGSRVTGIALLLGDQVLWGAELTHRGLAISASLASRKQLRRGRRGRKTRYRKARFLNRTRPKGWLAPSLMHRVLTVQTWVNKLIRFASVGSIVQELVRFDLQQTENPEISGTEYQQGTLYGYEVREYLLAKWDRQCSYCSKKDVALEIEHIQPKSKGGSNRVSNLCLACHSCNQRKGNREVQDFLKGKPEVLKRILAQAKRPLRDAAAVNSTRWKLFETLKSTGLEVSTGSGGKTKFNRIRLGLPKTHWLDAACVGDVDTLEVKTIQPLLIKCTGHGTRQMCGTDKYGFPKRHRSNKQIHFGFKTGDIVKAVVPKGKKQGVHVGRVSVRSVGSFNISTSQGLLDSIGHKYCSILHSKDGYAYG